VLVRSRFSNTIEQPSEPAAHKSNDRSDALLREIDGYDEVILERTGVAQAGFKGTISDYLRRDIDAEPEGFLDGTPIEPEVELVEVSNFNGETRMIDASTGGEKGRKLARFDLLPPGALWTISEHFGKGAEKYAERNWERGYAWSLSYGALLRYLMEWWYGEDNAPELDSPHLAAAGFHVLALLHFAVHLPDGDDRP